VQKHFDDNRGLNTAAWAMLLTLGVQFTLGLAAYVIMVNEAAAAIRSTTQIVLASSHVLVGAVLMGTTTATTLLAARTRPAYRPVTELLEQDEVSRDEASRDAASIPHGDSARRTATPTDPSTPTVSPSTRTRRDA